MTSVPPASRAASQSDMSPLIDWDSPTWGQPGHNVHQAAWAADGRHDDVTEDQ